MDLLGVFLLEEFVELDARGELPVDHRVPAVAHSGAIHDVIPRQDACEEDRVNEEAARQGETNQERASAL